MNVKSIIVILVLASAGVGAYLFLFGPKQVPDLVLQDAAGDEIALSEVMGDKMDLLVIVLIPRCPICQFSMKQIRELF